MHFQRYWLALIAATCCLPLRAEAQCGERNSLPHVGGSTSSFGEAVAITDDHLIVSSSYAVESPREVFVYSAATRLQLAVIPVSSNNEQYFNNTWVSQALEADGSLLAVGVPGRFGAPSQAYAGAVLLYDLSSFTQIAELRATPIQTHAGFGAAVDICGQNIAVSAPGGFGTPASAVFVFSADALNQPPRVVNDAYSDYGLHIALDGSHLLVSRSDVVRVHQLDATLSLVNSFSLVAGIEIAGLEVLDDRIFVLTTGTSSKTVQVYDLNSGSLVHTIQASFAGDIGPAISIDSFGDSLSNGTLVVGYEGVIYTYDTATLSEQARYVAGSAVAAGPFNNHPPYDHGQSVAISANWVLAGATGEAVLFDRDAPCELTTFCYGDGTSGSPCLCGNTSAVGAREGCKNSTGVGATLRAVGSTALVDDDMQFVVDQGPAGQPGVFVQGETTQALPFFDGILCMGNPTKRLSFAFFDGLGHLQSSGSLATQGGVVAPGATRHYQLWYRDPSGSPCGTKANLTNGVRVDWM